ncbi:acyltransferase family protein [Fluviicola taffensis]|uniref:Acyltransferase 3 n=1 Tax=Fluviicola taffensis (strain DSM 16823 / NCIMB 13979 / RW262) TaxID=755732 RepID=F2IF39_FLUTR|nr:acyltransferase [Fluviicola taffensis]AEA43513.1 acyltransferase 3 [Fluviicola taffensis DSM 16823]
MTKQLKGLETLRALAALVVLWGHIELLKQREALPNLIDSDFTIFPDGHIAVVLFFVLSGFLITYILVGEKEIAGKISYKNFILRRVLRILPLYYTILILSFLLIDSEYSSKTILLCFSIFPNIADALNIEWTASPQIWSIGVEEQFYLFWPLLLMLLPEKRVVLFLVFFFVVYSLLPHIIGYINVRTAQDENVTSFVGNFFHNTKFNCIAVGAFFGYGFARKKNWLTVFCKNSVFIGVSILTFSLWFSRFELVFFTEELFAVLFGIMLVGIVQNETISIDTKISVFLGKISYGIYMYHWIILVLLLKYLPKNENGIVYNLLLYSLALFFTILISWISRITLEQYFLNLKGKYRLKKP